MPKPTPPSRRVHAAWRLAGVAALLAVAFHVSVESSSRLSDAIVREALHRGADRLIALQRPDGLWSVDLVGPGDIASSGRCGRALVAAWRTTRDPAHLAAAMRTAEALLPRVPHGEAAASLGNLMFLVEIGRVSGEREFERTARDAWERRFTGAERLDGALVGRNLMARPNMTTWLEGSWRNFLLGRAADEAELARLLGKDEWAEALAVAAARSWAPKHDYEFWATATGGVIVALGQSTSVEGMRLREFELSLLRQDEIAPGLPWSDTPYDSSVCTYETAGALRGLIASRRPDARAAAQEAAVLVAMRQASNGGWGSSLALFDQIAEQGSCDAPAAELAAGELPEIDAQIVLALAESLFSPILPAVPQS